MTPLRILIVDDHFLMRMGLSAAISAPEIREIVAEAESGAEAIELYRQYRPDVVLMDIRMPNVNGLAAISAICDESPEARILGLSTFDADEFIFRAFQAGARGFILKSAPREELLAAIEVVARGERYVPQNIASILAERARYAELNERELEVLDAIVHGRSNKEIAASLGLSEIAIKVRVSHVLEKLRVQDRTQAAIKALRRGLVEPE